MSKVPTNPPSGFRDFLPQEASARLDLVSTITRLYRAHGFQPIGIPMLENLSTLQGKGGGSDNEKLIFKVMKRGDDLARSLEAQVELADMGLRFDLTLPLARYCARFREQLPKPFKVFQIGPVWRADRPQKGRFREFFQCDVDIIGSKEIGAEVDCISAILEVFDAVGMKGVEVHLNDRRLLSALKDAALSSEQWADALVTLDKLDKIERAGVEEELKKKFGSVPSGIEKILRFSGAEDGFAGVHPESISNLQNTIALLKLSTSSKIDFNPSLVRGQDYYTGTIFEVRHPDLSGSLGGGGRYNRLMEVFGAPETPAFGGSIGFERLVMLLQEQTQLCGLAGVPQIFFPLFNEELRAQVLPLANGLRALGLSVDTYPDASQKFGKQLAYCSDRKIPFALVLGPSEAAAAQIKVKDMAAGTESTHSISNPASFFEEMRKLCNKT
ncbi:MAG: histidine--tRNA ligase [Bdellovibrionota bacterium]